jgi:hypothetical protein
MVGISEDEPIDAERLLLGEPTIAFGVSFVWWFCERLAIAKSGTIIIITIISAIISSLTKMTLKTIIGDEIGDVSRCCIYFFYDGVC